MNKIREPLLIFAFLAIGAAPARPELRAEPPPVIEETTKFREVARSDFSDAFNLDPEVFRHDRQKQILRRSIRNGMSKEEVATMFRAWNVVSNYTSIISVARDSQIVKISRLYYDESQMLEISVNVYLDGSHLVRDVAIVESLAVVGNK